MVVEEHGDDDGDLLATQHGGTQASERGEERAYGSRRARTTTRRPDVEIEHDVVRGARVADADVAKLVDGEHARLLRAVADEIENAARTSSRSGKTGTWAPPCQSRTARSTGRPSSVAAGG